VADTDPWAWGWGAVEAIAVTLALIAAAIAVGLEIRAGKQRDRELNERAEDERRRQASAVSIWPTGAMVDDPVKAPRNRRYPKVAVRNSSPLPVSAVWILVVRSGIETVIDDIEVLAAGGARLYDLPTDLHAVPGTDMEQYRLRFVDANGRRWERNGRGGLTQIEDSGRFGGAK
jgi:hypothetical protein